MKKAIIGAVAVLATSAPAFSAGVERSTQSIGILFEEGNYAEFSAQVTNPNIDGTDIMGFRTKGVAEDFNTVGLAYKHQFSPALSAALIIEHPYGADIDYPVQADGGSIMLGGTKANVESAHISGILRYKFNDSFGVHGGLRVTKASGDITLNGLAYGGAPPTGVSSYRAKMQDDTAVGWLAGISWERPDIAARVALTYYSEIEHDFKTTERFGALTVNQGTTTVKTPKQIALDFQTGVAANTLVFGQIRRIYWSDFRVDPPFFTSKVPSGLVNLEDSTTYTLGVGYRFNEQWSGSAAITYEPEGDDLVSPLAPVNGQLGLTLAGVYTQDNWKITGGINYTKLGDSKPETGDPDTVRADMTDNSAVSLGLRIGYRF
ncbi:MAG: OmpP1/FadL family transporter [Paracoccus sp. (in: a-proteobacteria)]